MKRRLAKVFYALIIDRNKEDHSLLRNTLNRMIPNIIIESIYDEEETIAYFENCKKSPDLVFLDMNMHCIFLKFVLHTFRKTKQFSRISIAVVNASLDMKTREELKVFGVNEFYLDLKRKVELRLLSYDLKNKWQVF